MTGSTFRRRHHASARPDHPWQGRVAAHLLASLRPPSPTTPLPSTAAKMNGIGHLGRRDEAAAAEMVVCRAKARDSWRGSNQR